MNKKKFNINNYFNGKLFCEAFKQLRIVGIAALICLNALAIFLPIINYLERKEEFHLYPGRILFNPESIMMPMSWPLVPALPAKTWRSAWWRHLLTPSLRVAVISAAWTR